MRYVADDGEEFDEIKGPFADFNDFWKAMRAHPLESKLRAGCVVTDTETGSKFRLVDGSIREELQW